MAIVKGGCTIRCSEVLHGPVTTDEAKVFAAVSTACQTYSGRGEVNWFQEIGSDAFPDALSGKCFVLPPVLNERSIELAGGCTADSAAIIDFSVDIDFMFFAKGKTAEETMDLAVAYIEQEDPEFQFIAEPSRDTSPAVPDAFVMRVPAEIPNSVLQEFLAHKVRRISAYLPYGRHSAVG